MAIEITVPRLGWSMEEAIFSSWLKAHGEMIRAGDLLFAIESDKATQDIESFDEGILHLPASTPQQGDTVLVGQVIAYLLAPGETAPDRGGGPGNEAEDASDQSGSPDVALHTLQGSGRSNETPHSTEPKQPSPTPTNSASPISTPRARRTARELGIDWTTLTGTGRDGRIREADIRAQAPNTLTSTRRLIGERMMASQQKTAPVTLHTTADATALVHHRTELKSSGATLIPSYNDMLAKLTVAALQAHPVINSRWEGENLITSRDIHLGMAVDTENGLLVPVLRDIAKLSLQEIATRFRDLTERARTKRLTPDELRGGTFTISSLGSFGIDAFTPIINFPECAILGVGRIVRQPVADGDAIILRDILTLSLTFDHRAFDGAPAARFLQTLTSLIEAPMRELVS